MAFLKDIRNVIHLAKKVTCSCRCPPFLKRPFTNDLGPCLAKKKFLGKKTKMYKEENKFTEKKVPSCKTIRFPHFCATTTQKFVTKCKAADREVARCHMGPSLCQTSDTGWQLLFHHWCEEENFYPSLTNNMLLKLVNINQQRHIKNLS